MTDQTIDTPDLFLRSGGGVPDGPDAAPTAGRQVAVVDTAVAGHEALAAAAEAAGLHVVRLSGRGDGVAEMAAALSGFDDIDALHILSHGDSGRVHLGDAVLSSDSLDDHASALGQVAERLADDGDLLLYGCRVGAGAAGSAFLDRLAVATGADVAASDDLTGAADRGGDWTLEIAAGDGAVEHDEPFSAAALADFTHVLAPQTYQPENFAGLGTQTLTSGDGFTVTATYEGSATNIKQYTDGGYTGVYATAPLTDPLGKSATLTVSADGTTVSSFELTDLSLFEYFLGGADHNWSSLGLSAVPAGGGPNLTGTVTDPAGNYDIDVTLGGIAGQQITSFTVSFTADTTSSRDAVVYMNIDSFTVDNVTGGNAPPTISIGDMAASEGDAAADVDSAATVNDTDGDADWNGGALTLQITANADAGDEISIDQSGNFSIAGGTLSRAGTGAVGTVTESSGTANDGVVTGGALLTITFNASATNAIVQELAQSIQYRTTSEDPTGTAGTRTLTATATDGPGDSGSDTATITLTGLNDDPTATDNAVTTNEDTNHVFAAGEFNFNDVDSADTLQAVRIDSIPATGTLFVDANNDDTAQGGEILANGDTVAVADITAGNLQYTPPTDQAGTPLTTFTFSVGDGTAFAASASTMTVNVTAQNDAPTATDNTVTTAEDTNHVFAAGEFNFNDVDSADTLQSVRIDGIPATGTLFVDANNDDTAQGGEILANGDTVAVADITAGNLQYTPPTDQAGTPLTTFTFSVGDGTAFAASASTMTVNVTAQNDAPTATDNTVTTNEDTNHVFAAGEFNFNDADTGDTLQSVRIDGIPATGTLFVDANNDDMAQGGEILANGDTVAVADITAGNLQYTPPTNQAGTALSTFTFSVGDGTAFAASASTMTVDVTAQNDPPAFAGLDGTPTYAEDGAAVTLDANVTVADVELDARNGGNGDYSGAGLTIARTGGANADDRLSVASGGNLTVAGGPDGGGTVSAGGNVIATIANTGNGQLQLTFADNGTTPTTALVNEVLQAIQYANASDDPPASVQLDWTVSDGNSGDAQGSGDNPGTDTGSTTVSITSVNDPPTLTATGQDPTFVEGTGAPGSDLFSGVTASTVEAADRISSLTLTVTNVSDGASEILRVDGSDVALTDGNTVTPTATNGLTLDVSVTGSTATVSFTGASLTAAQVQTLVDALAYRNTSEDPTTGANRVVTLTELVDTGGGTDTAALTLTSTVGLTAVNDPPVVGNVFGDSASQVTAGAGAQDVTDLNDATVANPDSADYDGGSLTLAQDSGTTNGSWGLDGTTTTAGGDGTIAAGETVAVGGVSIGTVDATNDGQGGNTLEIAFNANATSARIETLIQALTYDAPSGLGARQFTLTLNDADGTATGGDQDDGGAFTLTVTPNPPVIGNLDGDSVTAASGATVAVDAGGDATVTDADSADFDGGTLTVTRTGGLSGDFGLGTGVTSGGDGTIAAGETVAVGGTNIGTVTTDGQGTNDLVITFTSTDATPAAVQTLLRALEYAGSQAGAHPFAATITDAGANAATSTPAAFTVTVEAPPVNTVPGAQTAVDGTALALGGISVADADSATVTTTVSVPGGDGTFSATGAATITGDGTESLQIAGTLADVNATLGTLVYTPAVDSTGAQTVTVLSSDGTNTDTDTIAVTVQDRPTLLDLDGDTVKAGLGGTVAIDRGTAATVTDGDSADFDGGTLTVTRVSTTLTGGFSLDAGQATAGGDGMLGAGETVAVGGTDIGTVTTAGQGTDDLVITFSSADATPARVGMLLNALLYAPGQSGDHVFDVTVTDGAAGTPSEAARVTVAGGDPPENTAPATWTALTGNGLPLRGLAVADPDSATVTTTLSVAAGAGVFGATGPAAVAGGGSATLTITGALADVNATLATVTYTAATDAATPGAPGTQTITMTTTDGDQTDTDTIAVTVVAPAPPADPPDPPAGPGDGDEGGDGDGGTGDGGDSDGGNGGDGDGTTETVEGTTVTTTTETRDDGTVVETITIDPFDGFQEGEDPDDFGNGLSDHVVAGADDDPGLRATLPLGVGLTASGPSVRLDAAAGVIELQNGLRVLLGDLPSEDLDQAVQSFFAGQEGGGSPRWVSTLTPTFVGDGTPDQPITIDGGDGGDATTAVIIDARDLPPGATLALDNIGLAIVIGDVTVTGGAGTTFFVGDDGAQDVNLGVGDDTLDGGGGDDIVRSREGDDILIGGSGSDTLGGGAGVDVAQIAATADVLALTRAADGSLLLRHGTDVDTIEPDVEILVAAGDGAMTLSNPGGAVPVAGLAFDPAFYLEHNPDVAAAVAAGALASAADHFAAWGLAEGRAPNALWDEAAYRDAYPDVAAAVAAGTFASGLQHYALFGAAERRDPGPWFDASAYLDAYPDVAATGLDALTHFVLWGAAEGRLGTVADDTLLLA
ncbi:DUF4347 domain-containing protein [Roseospira goensis]|uniref:DUF4347 domain-containing protein n=1 Tax=Roseospira goensis TaxID=391922 RepID=A0A7W6WJA7_9PROT|nr:DUF4347 domain-containing protein [Roseospira goensis]MBB4284820.1 hypothetical protein [Roseospira goensis]